MHCRPRSQLAFLLCLELVILYCALSLFITKLSNSQPKVARASRTHSVTLFLEPPRPAFVFLDRGSIKCGWSGFNRAGPDLICKVFKSDQNEATCLYLKSISNSSHTAFNKTSSAMSFIFQLEQIHTDWILSLYKLKLRYLSQGCLSDSNISFVFNIPTALIFNLIKETPQWKRYWIMRKRSDFNVYGKKYLIFQIKKSSWYAQIAYCRGRLRSAAEI